MQWEDVKYNKSPKIALSGNAALNEDIDMFPDYCYGHKMTVVTCKREVVKLNDWSQVDYGKETNYIIQEGVYMFGGVRGSNQIEFKLSSAVYRMSLGDSLSLPVWSELETKGKPPMARFHHG